MVSQKSHFKFKQKKGNVLVALVVALAVAGIFINTIISRIIIGQQGVNKENFSTDGENLFDLIKLLIISPTTCNNNFTGLTLVPSLTTDIGTAPGATVANLRDLHGNSIVSLGTAFSRAVVQKLQLYDLGPVEVGSTTHFIALYMQTVPKFNTPLTYSRTAYFYVISDPLGTQIVNCAISGTVGNINSVGVYHLPGSANLTGDVMKVRFGYGVFLADYPSSGIELQIGAGTITGSGCVPVPPQWATVSFQSATLPAVPYSQAFDPVTSQYTNCVTTTGTLLWQFSANQSWIPP